MILPNWSSVTKLSYFEKSEDFWKKFRQWPNFDRGSVNPSFVSYLLIGKSYKSEEGGGVVNGSSPKRLFWSVKN